MNCKVISIKLNKKLFFVAYTLNNLACASWLHQKDVSKQKTIPEITTEKASAE